MSTELTKSILYTLSYFDIFNYPLTLIEIQKYLYKNKAKLDEILNNLEKLEEKKLVAEKNGFYFLWGRENIVEERKKHTKIADKKWKIARKIISWLTLIPFIKMIGASGSLALSNTNKESDLDILVVAKYKRIFTCRFFLVLLTTILGKKRKGKKITNRLCPNHFITTESLSPSSKNLFSAVEFAKIVPIFDTKDTYLNFKKANSWIYEFLPSYSWDIPDYKIKENKIFVFKRNLIEKILSGNLGNVIENILKKIQKKRLVYKGRIIANDKELEFHPEPQEIWVLEKFKDKNTKFPLDKNC